MAHRRLSHRQVERIKKIQERRRQKVAQRSAQRAEDLIQSLGEDGLGAEQTGLVVANLGPTLIVEDSQGALYRCALRQNLGMAVCGDRVVWQTSGNGTGVVIAIEESHSLLSRPDYSGRLKPVAANLDQVAVVVAPRPALNEFLIDRYLVAIHNMNATALLVINKIDLLDTSAYAAMDRRLATYRRIGYTILHASTLLDRGLDELKDHLNDRTSILVGQSGVGKSSLVKVLLPNREIRIQALSKATGLGTHTTTTSTLYHLPDGGNLIDSPGVRSFELGTISNAELERGFLEFGSYLGRCKFSNCSHTVEPGCALLAAVQQRAIDARRLESYYQIRKASLKD